MCDCFSLSRKEEGKKRMGEREEGRKEGRLFLQDFALTDFL